MMVDSNDLVNGVPYSWLPAYGEAVESNTQSNRNVLETILEENSDDDEDSGQWNNIGSTASWNSSSNSDTDHQSVIEVDVNQGMTIPRNYTQL